jgi:hypothetical protein
MTEPNIIYPQNIFELENQVIADLNAFNKAYQTYIICKNTIDNAYFINRKSELGCQSGTASALALEIAYKKLINEDDPNNKTGSLYRLKDAIDQLPPETDVSSTEKAEYLKNYRVLMFKYQNVLKKRQALDASLTELYEIGDTGTNFYQKKLISTSYTKILLTILATTLTVAAFMTMRNKQ